jgi:hypothetical protein
MGRRPGVQLVRHLSRAYVRKDQLATPRCARRCRSSSTTSTCRRAGARRRRSPT